MKQNLYQVDSKVDYNAAINNGFFRDKIVATDIIQAARLYVKKRNAAVSEQHSSKVAAIQTSNDLSVNQKTESIKRLGDKPAALTINDVTSVTFMESVTVAE